MKKLASCMLCLTLLFLSVPIAADATSSDTEVISTHGSKTYMGTASDWSDTWDSDNFTEVTDEDIDTSSDLIIKGGKVGDVSVDGEADLTIKGGSMSDVSSDGAIEMTGGTVGSLETSDDIAVSGGTVSGNIDADGAVTLTGALTVGGTVSGEDVAVYASNSGSSTTVSGGVSFSGKMTVEGSKYALGTVDGQSSGTLEFEDASGTLPEINQVEEIDLDSESKISASGSLEIGTLSISNDSEFIASSALTVGTVSGPGTLVFSAGRLTVDTAVSNTPIFDLNGTAASGVTAFKAESGVVSTSDMTVFGYTLTKNTYSSEYDGFTLSSPSGNGVALDASTLHVSSGSSATVTATVTPAISELSSGTQLCWKLVDPSSGFTITPNSTNHTCSVSASDSSTACKATLAAYLADSSGNILPGYKTAICTLTSESASSTVNTAASFTCDTHSTVIIKKGKNYQARITSSSYPNVVAGTGGVVFTRLASRSGNNYYFTFTGIKTGCVGIYIGGSSSAAFTCSIV